MMLFRAQDTSGSEQGHGNDEVNEPSGCITRDKFRY